MDTTQNDQTEIRHTDAFIDGSTLNITITDEGVITDLFDGDEHVGTSARTFDEIADLLRE